MTGKGGTAPVGAKTAFVGPIFLAGLAAGLADFIYGSVRAILDGGSPMDPWKGVASGLFGPQAYEGGLKMVLLGTGLHFFICIGAAALLYLILRRQPWLVRRPLVTGVLYGVGFLLVMNYVILPLSRIGQPVYPLDTLHVAAFWHVLLVGLPTAWILTRTMRADVPQVDRS